MTVTESPNEFVVNGIHYPFKNFVERHVQGVLIQRNQPPFPFFDELKSWPLTDAVDFDQYEVVDGAWVHSVIELKDGIARGDVVYPCKNEAERIVCRDLARLQLPPIDWSEYSASRNKYTNRIELRHGCKSVLWHGETIQSVKWCLRYIELNYLEEMGC
jgi:hypothetical protein